LRLLGLSLAVFLPGLYVALVSVNPDVLPAGLAITIAASREGLAYPALVETLFMMLTLDLLAEASSRLPSLVGSTAVVVGGLILGPAAAQARLISNFMIIVIAAMAIGSATMPNYEANIAWRISKYVVLGLASLLGLYGLVLGLILLLLHLSSLDSFGVPYLSPLGPLEPTLLARDTFIRLPHWILKRKPHPYRRLTRD